MKPKSTIEKGKRFEKFIAAQLTEWGFGECRREIGSGSGKKKGDIFANLPFLLECKNQDASIKKILDWIDQSKRQAEIGNWAKEKWAMIFRDPRTGEFQDIYTVIDFWEFLKLLKKNQEPRIKEPDRSLRFEIEKMVASAKRVIKELEK